MKTRSFVQYILFLLAVFLVVHFGAKAIMSCPAIDQSALEQSKIELRIEMGMMNHDSTLEICPVIPRSLCTHRSSLNFEMHWNGTSQDFESPAANGQDKKPIKL